MDETMRAVVEDLEEYLTTAALNSERLPVLVDGFGTRARAGGISLARVMVGYRLLNPIFNSQTAVWEPETGCAVELHRHGESETSPDFLASPVYRLISSDETEIRRRIEGANAPLEYPVLTALGERGMTDYLAVKVSFTGSAIASAPGDGLVFSFASERQGGFLDEEIEALGRLKRTFALAVRTRMETKMRQTLATTYLGRTAGGRVLGGEIARGEGRAVDAVIWYCDLRGSTALCEQMGVAAYLPLLDDYFSASAGVVDRHGGDILDFIGDAVLAIFPQSDAGLQRALDATREAQDRLAGFAARHSVFDGRSGVAEIAGIAIDVGTVVYGNIGIEERLTFSVIGPSVNKVARIERLTKTLRETVLVTDAVAKAAPELFRSRGTFALDGVAGAQELFGLTEALSPPAAPIDRPPAGRGGRPAWHRSEQGRPR